MVEDESIRDTLIDLANYAVMTVAEMDRAAEAEREKIAEKHMREVEENG